MSLNTSIRNGFSWLLFGSVGNRAIEFIFGIILARLLVPADFGLIVTVSVLTGLASLVSSGGMGQSLIRAKEVNEEDFCAVFTLQFIICSLWYTVFYISSPYIAIFFKEPIYTDLIRVNTLVFLIKPFTYMRMAWLNREMEFKKRSIISIIIMLLTGGTSILMAWHGFGVWSLVLSGLLGALINNMLLGIIIPLRLTFSLNTTIMKKHSSFGLKITTLDILSYLSREGKILIIGKLLGPSIVGLFNKAESQSKLANSIIMPSLMQPVFRVMAKEQDDLDKTKYLLYRSITLVSVLTTPIYIGLWWVAEPFILTLYGEKWLASAEPLRILVIAGFFFNMLFPFGALLNAQNKLTQEIIVSILKLCITISACLIGIEWGIIGVAIGIVISYIPTTIMIYYLVTKTISTNLFDLIKALFPSILLGTLLFIVLSLVDFFLKNIGLYHPTLVATYPILESAYTTLYLLTMIIVGGLTYALAFIFIPITPLNSEVKKIRNILRLTD